MTSDNPTKAVITLTASPSPISPNPTSRPPPTVVVSPTVVWSPPFTLQSGYELVQDIAEYVIVHLGEDVASFRQGDLKQRILPGGREIYDGLMTLDSSDLALGLPDNSRLVIDAEGYLAILDGERIVGVVFNGRTLTLPFAQRAGIENMQMHIRAGVPVVTSIRNTGLLEFRDGQWEPIIDPNEETEFVFAGNHVDAAFYFAGIPGRRLAGTWNVGELERRAELIVKFDMPNAYFYDSPLWGLEVLAVEGVALMPDGLPTLIRIPICVRGMVVQGKTEDCEGDIRFSVREDLAQPYILDVRDLPVSELLDLMDESRYAYVDLSYGLNEAKVPSEYSDHPIYKRYRHYQEFDLLTFLEVRGVQSPYVMPDLIASYALYGGKE